MSILGDVFQDSMIAYLYMKRFSRKSGKTRRQMCCRGGGSRWRTQRATLNRQGGKKSGKE